MSRLFEPLQLGDLTLPNRIIIAPMGRFPMCRTRRLSPVAESSLTVSKIHIFCKVSCTSSNHPPVR